VTRAIHIVTVAGRRFSPAVATFVKAVDKFKWPALSAVPQPTAQKSKLKAAS
jgi:hypothetical protein